MPVIFQGGATQGQKSSHDSAVTNDNTDLVWLRSAHFAECSMKASHYLLLLFYFPTPPKHVYDFVMATLCAVVCMFVACALKGRKNEERGL